MPLKNKEKLFIEGKSKLLSHLKLPLLFLDYVLYWEAGGDKC